MKMIRYLCTALFSAAMCVGVPALAYGHAALHHSEPSAGAVLNAPPASVRLWFSAPLEPSFSKVQVLDHAGKQVDKGQPKVSSDDAELLEVQVPTLPAGTYQVIWKIVARDGHKAKGNFSFTIK